MFLALLAMFALGCSSGERSSNRIDLWPALEKGGFVPDSYSLDLERNKARADSRENPWRPRTIGADWGWRVTHRGWRSTDESPILTFWKDCSDSAELVLRHRVQLKGATHSKSPARLSIRALLNGSEIGVIEADHGRSRSRLPLPSEFGAEVSRLELEFQSGQASSDVSCNQFWLLGLSVVCDASRSKIPNSASIALDQTAKTLETYQSGSFVIPLQVPDGAAEIRFQARAIGQRSGRSEARVGVTALRNETDSIELGSVVFGQDESGSDGWQDIAIPVGAIAGSTTLLMLEVEIPIKTAAIEFRHVELLAAADQKTAGRVAETSAKTPAQPDVVLIILDAARGDRFPGAGYFRQTVPNITKLADEAVVFRNAFSECPTTSCSIPGLIIGLSFLPGGKVEGGRKLSPEITTLAEHLKILGYRTVSLSSTPNHSTERNLHQGYDQFHQLWNQRLATYGPENMSRMADEIMRSQPSDEPLLLQLHYKPPHWPYKPGPEFDRFTEPDYDGPIDLGTSLKYYTQRTELMTDRDVEQMVGLYDGNLLRADAAVGMVLESLRQTGRWENTLIIITSDHGEAFMEHGRLGHNSTLFDEMLHVPLVVRLPGGVRPEQVEPDRMASALDVVPTILGQVSGAPQNVGDGIDLINSLVDLRRPRGLQFRLHNNKLFGSRTRRWKSIASPNGDTQMLFRIDEDPDELRNLLVGHPQIFAGMALQTQDRLRAAQSRGLVGEAVELTPEAEEALRALGYLN